MRSIMAELQKSFKASVLSESVLLLVLLLLCLQITVRPSMAVATPVPVPVGVILDLNSTLGLMVNHSLAFAVEDYYSKHTDTATKINLIVRNVPPNDVVAAAENASDLIEKDKVRAILGPRNSEQARYIVQLGEELQVPVIWFPITGPSLLPPPSPSFIYFNQGLHCCQFHAIADTIKALGWQSVIPIYEQTEYGSYLIPCLTNVFKYMGIQMVNVTAIDSDSNSSEIYSILGKLNNMRRHVFLVHMSMDLGTKFIRYAQYRNMMDEGYAWILTQELSSLTDPRVPIVRISHNGQGQSSTYPTSKFFRDAVPLKGYMQGALVVRPMDLVSKKERTWRTSRERSFRLKFNFESSLTIYGWWAYYTIEALARALEKAGAEHGARLRREIWSTSFTGDSGINFTLVNGQLDQSEYEVYNVIGQRERIIGNWSPKTRLVKNFSEVGKTSGEYPLKYPLWPGDTLDKPPKLRIGVPRTNFSPEFVNVDLYNSSKPLIYGFAINVFLKALDVLPFPFNYYEFVPLPNVSRSVPMTYDDILCLQMEVEGLDAIIGDITVVANRTKCVDFTLPYLDSSVAMVVNVKKASRSKGILLKPFERSLWLILGGIFAAATITIIILERNKASENNQTNERNKTNEFLFNPFLVYKIDVIEEFESGAAKWMVILTSFLFILVVQVYTANLTSILTQEQIKEPFFKDENETKNSNVSVGYRNGSWVEGFLIEQIGFNSSRLKPLASHEEYHSSLSNGTVGAIFDETPYLTLFLSKYKSHFIMTGSMFKTGGFAFAFPNKSSLVSQFSKAILNVTQDAESFRVLKAKSNLPTSIEDLKFEEDDSDKETSRLSITNFGGLYPVLLPTVALFLCLSTPSAIKWLLNTSVIRCVRSRFSRKLRNKLNYIY